MAIDLEVFLVKLEERLKTVPGLNVSLEPPPSITPPHAWIGMPPLPNYYVTMNKARVELRPTVKLLVSKTNTRAGTLTLARFANPAGDSSISTCLEADKTIGGTCETCVVEDFRPAGDEDIGALGYWGGVFSLLVIARGN